MKGDKPWKPFTPLFLRTSKHCKNIPLASSPWQIKMAIKTAHLLERARGITLLSPFPPRRGTAVNLSRRKRPDNIAWPNHHGNFSIPALFIGSLNAPLRLYIVWVHSIIRNLGGWGRCEDCSIRFVRLLGHFPISDREADKIFSSYTYNKTFVAGVWRLLLRWEHRRRSFLE